MSKLNHSTENYAVFADEGFPHGIRSRVYLQRGRAIERARRLFEEHSVATGQVLIHPNTGGTIYVHRAEGGPLIIEDASEDGASQ